MRRRTADIIREELEQAIVTGEFFDGQRLDEAMLSQRFNVSRTPIRETIQMLSATGLVKQIPRRGAFVRQPGFIELVEMFDVMAELESMCARLAARRITEENLALLISTVDDCERARKQGDSDHYYRENERFHHTLYAASGNAFLASEATKLHRRLQPYRRLQLRVRGRMNQSMDEHREIVAAIAAGDEQASGKLARDHISIQGEKFNDLMAQYQLKALKPAG